MSRNKFTEDNGTEVLPSYDYNNKNPVIFNMGNLIKNYSPNGLIDKVKNITTNNLLKKGVSNDNYPEEFTKEKLNEIISNPIYLKAVVNSYQIQDKFVNDPIRATTVCHMLNYMTPVVKSVNSVNKNSLIKNNLISKFFDALQKKKTLNKLD